MAFKARVPALHLFMLVKTTVALLLLVFAIHSLPGLQNKTPLLGCSSFKVGVVSYSSQPIGWLPEVRVEHLEPQTSQRSGSSSHGSHSRRLEFQHNQQQQRQQQQQHYRTLYDSERGQRERLRHNRRQSQHNRQHLHHHHHHHYRLHDAEQSVASDRRYYEHFLDDNSNNDNGRRANIATLLEQQQQQPLPAHYREQSLDEGKENKKIVIGSGSRTHNRRARALSKTASGNGHMNRQGRTEQDGNATIIPRRSVAAYEDVPEEISRRRQVQSIPELREAEKRSEFKRQSAAEEELDLAVNRLHILESLDAQLRQFVENGATLETGAVATVTPTSNVSMEAAGSSLSPSENENESERERASNNNDPPSEPEGEPTESSDETCVLMLNWAFEAPSSVGAAQSGGAQPGSCLASPQLKRQIPPYMLNLYLQLRAESRSLAEATRLMPYQSLVMRSFRQPALDDDEMEAWSEWDRASLEGAETGLGDNGRGGGTKSEVWEERHGRGGGGAGGNDESDDENVNRHDNEGEQANYVIEGSSRSEIEGVKRRARMRRFDGKPLVRQASVGNRIESGSGNGNGIEVGRRGQVKRGKLLSLTRHQSRLLFLLLALNFGHLKQLEIIL